MNLAPVLIDALWAALFAMAMAVVLSAPLHGLVPSFCGGFVARFMRDVLIAWGAHENLAVLIAAAAVVAAAGLICRPGVSPMVMVSAVIPLGAARPFFGAIVGFLQISSLKGEETAGAPLALISNLSKVFTTTLAIAVGVSMGVLIVRFFRRGAVQ